MKVAVFGGSGFIGEYIVKELLSQHIEVISCDLKKSTCFDSEIQEEVDILDKDVVSSVFKKHNFDSVFNLAGFANLDKAVKDPYNTFNLNVLGNINLLESAKEHGVKHFVYASSAYAMSDKGSFYGISKLTSEKIVEEYHTRYGMNFSILRYGSVYSERDFENNYIFNLVKKAIDTKKIEHGGDGNEIREYIHAEDAARLSVDVLLKKDLQNKHLMLTGQERMKRVELFEMINEILNNSIAIELESGAYNNHYKYTPYSFSAKNSQKITANPYIDMGQGILNCIKVITQEDE